MFPVFQHLIDISIKVIPSGFHIHFYKQNIFTLLKVFKNLDAVLPFLQFIGKYVKGFIFFMFLRLKSLFHLYTCVMIFKGAT